MFAKDFEFDHQHYLLISLQVDSSKNLLALFKIAISKVICCFEVPYKVKVLAIQRLDGII